MKNEAAPLLAEYITRQRLAKLGYRFDPRELSTFKADVFLEIGQEIQKLEAESMKKGSDGR